MNEIDKFEKEKEEFQKYLYHRENYCASYHERKERMSWLSVVFFGILVLAGERFYIFVEDNMASLVIAGICYFAYISVFFYVMRRHIIH